MRLFVTGATGFIGRAFCEAAVRRGLDLLCLTRDTNSRLPDGCRTAPGSLEEVPWAAIEDFQPDGVVHLAWEATPGEYLHSPRNGALLEQSKSLFAGLVERGLRHIVAAGTCIEYAAQTEPLDEERSPAEPIFPYSRAKHELHRWLGDEFSGSKVSWSWLRIFYPYGPGEPAGKPTSTFARKLASGETVTLKTPDSVKDFIYIDDLAEAICAAVLAPCAGPVNLGTGSGVSIREIAATLAKVLDLPPSRVEGAVDKAVDPFPHVVADAGKIRSTGWVPRIPLAQGLERLLESLRPIT